ncbi:hypothetical protein [Aquisphaera giovannonii]|uniref:hypothetical protein n=1 Tax=Aquisphaera giovannonii TaxID=406548 RepID=UPI00143DCA04|nr:hypothetical protein [Aquisphaera giovannonii]
MTAAPPCPQTEKKCAKCGGTKSISNFAVNRSSKDGRQHWCRPCFGAYRRGGAVPGQTPSEPAPALPPLSEFIRPEYSAVRKRLIEEMLRVTQLLGEWPGQKAILEVLQEYGVDRQSLLREEELRAVIEKVKGLCP